MGIVMRILLTALKNLCKSVFQQILTLHQMAVYFLLQHSLKMNLENILVFLCILGTVELPHFIF
jgi:hypothetical protein